MDAPTVPDPDAAPPALHPDAERFALWLMGSAARAAALVADAKPTGDLHAQLSALRRVLPQKEKTQRMDLDAVLRNGQPTTAPNMQHELIRGERRRLNVLHRQLQRTCLAATLGRLTLDRRAAFILVKILGLSKADAADILGKTESAVDVLDCRAARELDNYLSPRCEHMDPSNACHCESRLPIALDRGFVEWPARDDLPETPLVARRHGSAASLYATLPPPA